MVSGARARNGCSRTGARANVHAIVDWNDLRYFLAIARAKSLAGAARELGVEHTTVSRRLNALEEALGTRLFARGPAGLTLTEEGCGVLPCVETIAAEVDRIARRASGGDGRVAGTVRLTIPESGSSYFMENLAELRARFPDLLVEVLSDNRPLDIRRGEADLAVRFSANSDQELVVRKAGTAGWTLYASPEYVKKHGALASLEALGDHVFIGFDASLHGAEGSTWLRAHVAPGQVVMRANTIRAVASAAESGIGIAPLPCFTAAGLPNLVRMTGDLIGTREILLVVHPDLVRVARVRATMDFLLELLRRDAAMWSGRTS